MKKISTAIAGLTVAGLVGIPVLGSADASTSPAEAIAHKYRTKVTFRSTDHTRSFGSTTRLRGQVVVPSLHGAVKGVRVNLYRKFDGSSRWRYLDKDYTSHKSRPLYTFSVRTRANAQYKVIYRGNDHLKPSRNSTQVSVYRRFASHLEDVSGNFHGRVAPNYRGKVVFLEKRSCANCGWHKVRHQSAGVHGKWHFKVGAPRSGRWWWRTTTPASRHFIASHSSVYSTSRG